MHTSGMKSRGQLEGGQSCWCQEAQAGTECTSTRIISRGHDQGTHLKQYHSSETAWDSSETAPLKKHQINNNKCTIKPTATASAHLSGSVAAPVVPLQVQDRRDRTHRSSSQCRVSQQSIGHIYAHKHTASLRMHSVCRCINLRLQAVGLQLHSHALELAWHVKSQAMLSMWLGCGPHQITITEDQWRV